MRIIGQAIRAVVIEMMGVVLVVWLLFGAAAWTVESYVPSPATIESPAQALAQSPPLQRLLAKINSVRLGWLEDNQEPTHRSGEVARLLDHYSNVYGSATVDHLKRVVN